MSESYRVHDVFTPAKPARASFVERQSVNDHLVDALNTPGKQLILYGHSGCGKTTLLVNKLNQVYENHVTSRATQASTFESLLLTAFDALAPFYLTETTSRHAAQMCATLSGDYQLIKAQLTASTSDETGSKSQRLLPPQLTPQSLARFLGEARAAWVLEDFHKVATVEKVKLAQTMKLFMDMADEYSALKVIAIGAVDTGRDVVEAEPEMRHRVAEIRVPLMSRRELEAIVSRGEQLLNVTIPYRVSGPIVGYSSGLAAICHQLCLNLCLACGVEYTAVENVECDSDHLDEALTRYVDGASDTLKATFTKAVRSTHRERYSDCRLILEALSLLDEEGAPHNAILGRIRQRHPEYPATSLTRYLNALKTPARGQVVRFDYSSTRYGFSDPLFRVFALAVFAKAQAKRSIPLTAEDQQHALEAVREMLEQKLKHA